MTVARLNKKRKQLMECNGGEFVFGGNLEGLQLLRVICHEDVKWPEFT